VFAQHDGKGVVDMDGYIALALVGLILFVAGALMRRTKSSKKPRADQLADYFKSYDERMDKFRK
jgi:hypothetical protein